MDLIVLNQNPKRKTYFIQQKEEQKSSLTRTQPFIEVDTIELANFRSTIEEKQVI